MLPPLGSKVANVKLRVTDAPVFEAMRCDEAMLKDNEATCPKIAPEATATDGSVSDEVCKVTPTALAATEPI